MMGKGNKYWSNLIMFLVGFLITSCRQSAITPQPTLTQEFEVLVSTLSAIQTENSSLKTELAAISQLSPTQDIPIPTQKEVQIASSTPIVTITPELQQTIEIPKDMITATHPEIPNYIFVVDPQTWEIQNPSSETFRFIKHKEIANCEINNTDPDNLGIPIKIYRDKENRLQWIVQQYEDFLIFEFKDLSLELVGFEQEDCLSAQNQVLNQTYHMDEYLGAPTITPAPTQTERPPLTGFTCPDTLPTRLRVGDNTTIVAEFLWLRKEPNPENTSAEIRLYPKYAPVTIRVIGGPKCISPFIYWEVEVIEPGEDAEEYNGWMAESDGENYFLEIWIRDW
jgi:hypothetical protein